MLLALFLFLGFQHGRILISGLSRSTFRGTEEKHKAANIEATPLYEDRNGVYISDLSNHFGQYGFWEVIDLPSRLTDCIIASEDRRFYDHPGVDPKSLARASLHNMLNPSVQGGSTIAMQVVRMQYPVERTVRNKLIEIYAAVGMTLRYGREGVLRQYMKIAPQGNQMHGFAYSARRYFKKPIEDLSWAEAALLTSVVRAPGELNLFDIDGFFRAKKRARIILTLLLQQGYIDRETYSISLNHLSGMSFQYRETRPSTCHHFIERLASNLQLKSNDPSNDPPSPKSAPVRTSLDMEIQDFCQKVADVGMSRFRPLGAGNIAIMVVDVQTGEVLGYIGSQDYFDRDHKGAINYADIGRSSGSTLKPFLFALGLQSRNFTPASVIPDIPFHVMSSSGEYTAGNFDDDFLGPMLYRRALGNSRNVPTLRILSKIGLDECYAFFDSLGLTGLTGGQDTTRDTKRGPDYYGYGLVLGGLYPTLEELVRAYGILANEGRRMDLRWQKKPDRELAQNPEYLIAESAARQISLFLSDPLGRLPTFPRLRSLDFPFPVAVKTGTSQGYRDAWALAYSSEYIVGVWMGHPDNDRMNHVTGSQSAELVRMIFHFLQPDAVRGIDEVPFPHPRESKPYKICIHSGNLATEHCPQVSLEYFEEGLEPHTPCTIHRQYAIDTHTGRQAAPETPRSQIELVTRAVFPPEYALWAANTGFEPPPPEPDPLQRASIQVISPLSGSKIILDPELPRKFQSLPLRAEVVPAVSSVTWFVNGEEYKQAEYPYEVRWPLEEGNHVFQAKFGRANVYSQKVHVIIDPY
jgi:penicillin-binding protein 1C